MKTSTLFLFCSIFCLTSSVFAQANAQSQNVKQRIMSGLKINSGKADSVLGILHDFNENMQSVKGNTSMKDDERKLAIQKEKKEEMARLHSQLSNAQIQKLQQITGGGKGAGQLHKSTGNSTANHQ